MNIEFMCRLLPNYSKELSEAATYREKGNVQLKHAKIILDKVKNCSIPDVVRQEEQLPCEHPEDKIWYNDKSNMQCNECGKEL